MQNKKAKVGKKGLHSFWWTKEFQQRFLLKVKRKRGQRAIIAGTPARFSSQHQKRKLVAEKGRPTRGGKNVLRSYRHWVKREGEDSEKRKQIGAAEATKKQVGASDREGGENKAKKSRRERKLTHKSTGRAKPGEGKRTSENHCSENPLVTNSKSPGRGGSQRFSSRWNKTSTRDEKETDSETRLEGGRVTSYKKFPADKASVT